MKTKTLACMLCLILCFSLATCAQASAGAAEPIHLTFWYNWGSTGASGQALAQAVDNFNGSQNDIFVELVFVSTDGATDSVTTKLITAVIGGDPPDMFLSTRGGMAEFMDVITPLNELAERDGITRDMFYPWAWDESIYDGTLLGLPYDGTARLLFYNKDHFAAAGLDPENPPSSIAELEAYAEQLTIKNGNQTTQYGFVPGFAEGLLFTWGLSFGGSFYDTDTNQFTCDNPENVEALTWMTGFAEELYGLSDARSFRASAGSGAGDPFVMGQLSMVVNGSWLLGTISQYAPDLNFGVANIPTPSGEDHITYIGGRDIIIPKGVTGERLEAAWTAIKFICADELGQTPQASAGNFPSRAAFTEMMYGEDPYMAKFAEILPYGVARPVSLATNMFTDLIINAPDLVYDGQDPEQVLTSMNATLNAEIARKQE